MSFTFSKGCRKRTAAALSLSLLVFGCSTIKDDRQQVSGPALGLVFFARVVTVLEARTDGSSGALYESAATDLSSDVASRTGLRNLQAIPTIIGALSGDIESRYAQTFCIYIVQTSDRRVTQSLAQTIFSSYQDESNLDDDEEELEDDYYQDEPTFDEDGEEIIQPVRTKPKPKKVRVPTPEEQSEEFLQEYVSVVQTCDETLVPNTTVFLTLTDSSPTIHRLDTNMASVFRTWQDLRSK